MREELDGLANEVREERRLQLEQMHKSWSRPLPERVNAGRALSRLVIAEIDHIKRLIHFVPPREDFAFFNENSPVRISQNDPTGHYFEATFLGLTDKGLSINCKQCGDLAFTEKEGWTLDEGFIDVSHFYLEAIKALGEEAHGRDEVFPVLFGDRDNEMDSDVYDEAMDELEESADELNDSQIDAVATALASSPFHLIQGPPGTGKTYTLALLVEKLVEKGHRILVTGFTHRSIHNALRKIQQVIGDSCPVVKISNMVSNEKLPFPVHSSFEQSDLDTHDGPYVIGATPFALFTKRLKAAHFDSAVLDETSQLNVPAAIMVMMKSDRWFFFGDHRQLPPVSMIHQNNPAEASVFARLQAQCDPTTLNTTYRMNAPLTCWPSEQFYYGELTSAVPNHRLAVHSSPKKYSELLAGDPSLVRVEVNAEGEKSRNDQEADLATDIIHSLIGAGVRPERIGVVTPYRSQASRIRSLLGGTRFQESSKLWQRITVDTVDRFQGQERDIILYSFTSSDLTFLKKLGSFLFQQARLNVAVTRARHKVILLHSPELKEFAEQQAAYSEDAQLFLSLLSEAANIPV